MSQAKSQRNLKLPTSLFQQHSKYYLCSKKVLSSWGQRGNGCRCEKTACHLGWELWIQLVKFYKPKRLGLGVGGAVGVRNKLTMCQIN